MISVIIPCYNEEKHIKEVLEKIPENIDEVVVVDDGSKDRTAEIVKGFSKVRLFRHEKNKGKGVAILTGIDSSRGDILVFMDGDMQHNPMEITFLVKPVLDGKADFVNGSRVLTGWDKFPITRKIGNLIARGVIRFFTKTKITDPLSGFKVIKRDALEKIDLKGRHYEIEADIIYKVLKNNLRVVELPISTQYATEKSGIMLVDNLRNFAFLIKEGIKFRFTT